MSETLTRNPNPQTQANDGAPQEGQAARSYNVRETGMSDEELLERFIGWYKVDWDHFGDWRQEATACFGIVAGHQWSDEDKQILRDQMRPSLTFNRVAPFIDAVGGLEINNRQETIYAPRQVGSSGKSDLISGAAQWARQSCDMEDEETEAFKDAVICGVGCIQSRMDYDDEPDGMFAGDRINPLEMLPDSASTKQNFSDGSHLMHIKDVPIEHAVAMFPDVDEQDLHAQWADDHASAAHEPHNARLAPYYRIDQSAHSDRQRTMVRMVEVEWWQYIPAWRVLDFTTGRFILIDDRKATVYTIAARAAGMQPQMTRDRKKVFYRAIVGNRILKRMTGAERGGFMHKFITGKRDQAKGYWYGLVRAMIDPQEWYNKWLSQGLHIINTNAKGGLLAETDAFADIDQARDDWASSDSIVEVNPGGLGKIQPKPPSVFPAQLNVMMQMATEASPAVSGVNIEMLGQSTSQAPQVALLEAGRKQQGMNVLAFLFNAKRRYQKEQGRLLLWMIQTYIADGRLIRIGGPEDAQYVPLIHDPDLLEYDVIVDDAPTSTNAKERVWGALMQMFPMLRGMQIPPQFYINALNYAPVPASFVQESQKILSQPPPPPPVNPAMQGRIALDQAQAQAVQAKAQIDQARAQSASALDQAKTASEQARGQMLAAQAAVLSTQAHYQPEQIERDADATLARTQLARAQAANQLQNAGLTQDDQRFKQAMGAIDAILNMHGAALRRDETGHSQQMDHMRHQAMLAQQEYARQAQQQAAGQQINDPTVAS